MGKLRNGVYQPLEDIADEIIRQEVASLPRSEKMDVLTPWKQKERYRREVYASEGIVDPSIRRGMFHREWNPDYPHLNARDGHTRPRRVQNKRSDTENTHYYEET